MKVALNMKAKSLVTLLVLSTAALVSSFIGAQDAAQAQRAAAGADDSAAVARQIPSYPLKTCVVSGEPLEEAIDVVQDGTLVRLCCKGCAKALAKKPAAIVAKVHAAVVSEQKASYPLETCVDSGESLGAMGEPVDMVMGTRLVRVCCKGCKKGVEKDAKAVMAKIDAALIEQQKASYPLDKCVVSGEPLEEPIDMLYGTRLVRVCCKGCKKALAKKPAEVLAKLDAAAKAHAAK